MLPYEMLEKTIYTLGIVSFFVLILNIRRIPYSEHGELFEASCLPSISVIIPARNEERNLAFLLNDLNKQTIRPQQIICVDDCSTDATAKVAETCNATLISVTNKPNGWLGKSYACHVGVQHAKQTELLLFLDADVRLAPSAIDTLLALYKKHDATISVQPFHVMKRLYESLSLFFNLISVFTVGLRLNIATVGLFGPVILISGKDYAAVGGHASVKESVIEDVRLGQLLAKKGFPRVCFVGNRQIRFRMYPYGLRSLIDGYVKNFADGANSANLWNFLLIFFTFGMFFLSPIFFLRGMFSGVALFALLGGLAYFIVTLTLFAARTFLGTFSVWSLLLYPIPLVFFIAVFFVSIVRKIFGLPVKWKGRLITKRKL